MQRLTLEDYEHLPSGYVKLLFFFQEWIEPPVQRVIAKYVGDNIYWNVLTSQITDEFRDSFTNAFYHDPYHLVTNEGALEHYYENTPERKREKEKAALFARVAAKKKGA